MSGPPAAAASAAAVARVDLAALRHNLDRARDAAPDSRIMAVIKGNAYGHGLLPVARALDAADALAVARVDEAALLREANITKPLLVLEGFHDRGELDLISELDAWSVVHTAHQVELLGSLPPARERKLEIWLKLDTGMHRLGFDPSGFDELHGRLSGNPAINVGCVMTHFACADDREDPSTTRQIESFAATVGDLPCARSLANSAAILGWPASHADWIRPGVMLFGASPFRGSTAADVGLRPVMTFCSRLIAIHDLAEGDRVGYGGVWTSSGSSRVGVVAAGYADGYPRETPNGTPVLVAGKRVPLAGRVSMDMLTVDLTDHADARIGDEVTLWGEGLPAEEVAERLGTIAYALLCGVTQRVSMEYTGA